MRAGILARVSTPQQATDDKTSIPDQLRRGHADCARNGWTVADEYIDTVSGDELEGRPALQRILADAEAGLLDVIWVSHTNRLARDDFVFAAIFHRLDRAEVKLCAAGRIYDPDNSADRLTRTIVGAADSYDKRELVRKMAQGQRARGLAGGWPGGSPPYGYRLVWPADRKAPPTVEHDPAEVEMLRRAVGLLVDDGLTTGQTCERLNALGYRTRGGAVSEPRRQPALWQHPNLRRVLASRAMVGQVWWGKPDRGLKAGHRTQVRRDGTPKYGEPVLVQLPPVIEQQRFAALQRALARRATGPKCRDQPYPNSGAESACGGRLGGVYRRDRNLRQYRCNRAKWRADTDERCACPRIDADWLDGQVWDEVVAVLTDPARLMRMAQEYLGQRRDRAGSEAATLGEIETKVATLEQARVGRAAEYLRAGVPGDVVAGAVAQIDRELAELLRYRAQLLAVRADERVQQERAVGLARLAEQAAVRCGSMALEQQREVLGLLAVEVTALDRSARPALLIEGAVPWASDLFGNPADEGPRSLSDGVTSLTFRLRTAA